VHLGDGGRGQRLPVEGGEDLVDPGAQLVSQHRFDLRPRHLRRVVLQPGQLGDELRRQQIAPGGQHLAELDERDPAVLQGQPQRASQPGPPLAALASSDRRPPRW
jgi:hypothetical protein